MAKKKDSSVGRPEKPEKDKVKAVFAYLTAAEKKKINDKYGNITTAVREEILPKC